MPGPCHSPIHKLLKMQVHPGDAIKRTAFPLELFTKAGAEVRPEDALEGSEGPAHAWYPSVNTASPFAECPSAEIVPVVFLRSPHLRSTPAATTNHGNRRGRVGDRIQTPRTPRNTPPSRKPIYASRGTPCAKLEEVARHVVQISLGTGVRQTHLSWKRHARSDVGIPATGFVTCRSRA